LPAALPEPRRKSPVLQQTSIDLPQCHSHSLRLRRLIAARGLKRLTWGRLTLAPWHAPDPAVGAPFAEIGGSGGGGRHARVGAC
jgi:hypothetical protein